MVSYIVVFSSVIEIVYISIKLFSFWIRVVHKPALLVLTKISAA